LACFIGALSWSGKNDDSTASVRTAAGVHHRDAGERFHASERCAWWAAVLVREVRDIDKSLYRKAFPEDSGDGPADATSRRQRVRRLAGDRSIEPANSRSTYPIQTR